MRWLAIGLLLTLPSPIQEPDVVWKCYDPDRPVRFATSEESRDAQTPEQCREWVEIRASHLAAILDAIGSERFEAANIFLSEVGRVAGYDYPESGLTPITTSNLFEDPGGFGFNVSDVLEAPTGSLVVYDGLAGILVEVRRSSDDPWSRQILYPSAAREFELSLGELGIAGMDRPKILVPEGLGIGP